MPLNATQINLLQDFFEKTRFSTEGAVITDLDGTALHEVRGNIAIPESVKSGLKKIHELGRPVVLNTLRFPLSVMRSFGREWYGISNAPVPTVLMNGSMLGYLEQDDDDQLSYREIDAYPLLTVEIVEIINSINALLAGGINDLTVFYYSRNWKKQVKLSGLRSNSKFLN